MKRFTASVLVLLLMLLAGCSIFQQDPFYPQRATRPTARPPLVLTMPEPDMPTDEPPIFPYIVSQSSITTSGDTNWTATNYFGVPELLYVHSLTNTGLTNIVSTATNYYGDYYIIWTQTSLNIPFTAVGIQVSNDQTNWVYYPDVTNYFRITPDQYGNLGMAFGSDDDMTLWFFRGVPE